MCGIAGIIHFDGQEVTPKKLEVMSSFMEERGPDFTGFWSESNIGFTHTRLSIIDLETRANQPMVSLDTDVILTYNGEIYNYHELQKELTELGHSFSTTSDTEVVLKAYQQWGIDTLLTKINGMFAFSILDKKNQTLLLVRDFFGKKPLYYFHNKETLLFSSDIRSIHQLKKSELTIDFESIDYYLTELSSPQPKTIWKEISQVKPAHYIKFNIDTGEKDETKYWSLKNHTEQNISREDCIEQTEDKVRQAILRRASADVPVGCFLSGGVDSGLVVSLLAQEAKKRINTYSIGLSYEKMNELPEAKIVADRYNTNHHEIILESDILHDLPKLIDYCGEPFADSSILPSFYASKAISEDLKVALSGDGGDELFGGYDDYGIAFRTDQFLGKYPDPIWRKGCVLGDKFISRFGTNRENLGSLDHYSRIKGSQRLFRQMGFSAKDKEVLYNKNGPLVQSRFTEKYLDELWDNHNDGTITGTLLKSSLKTRLLNDYLVKVDRSSMINSLEVRSPFLDKELAEWAFSIPNHFKFHNGVNKSILKIIAQKHIDPSILTRQKKGFGIPVKKWLRTDLFEWMRSILLGPSFCNRDFFDQKVVEKLIAEHKNGVDHTNKLWALICLELWFQKFVD